MFTVFTFLMKYIHLFGQYDNNPPCLILPPGMLSKMYELMYDMWNGMELSILHYQSHLNSHIELRFKMAAISSSEKATCKKGSFNVRGNENKKTHSQGFL